MVRSDKPNPLFYLFTKSWQYSAGNRHSVVSFLIMFLFSHCIYLIGQPLLWAAIMNTVQKEGVTPESLKTLLLLLSLTLLVEVVSWGFHGPARVLERSNAFKARVNYRRHMLQGVLTLPLEWHVEHHSGDTIDKIEKGSTGLFQFSGTSFEILYGFIQLGISCAMLVYFCPSAGPIVAALTLTTMWIVMRFDRVIVEQYRELSRAENGISESVFDSVSNVTTVIILRVEKLVFEAIMHKVERPFRLFRRNAVLNECKWFLTSVCCTVMAIAVLGVYFWQHLGTAGGILVGSTYLLVQYLDKMSETFQRFTTLYGDVLQRRAWVANGEELSADFQPGSFTNHVLPLQWQKLAIEDLDFAYRSEGTELNLRGISLSLKRGERIAFVGETGSGKTTLLKVMRDLYHPRGLKLSVDGKVVPHGFEGISRAIALVPQNPEIFATTILENITLGAEYEMDFVRRFSDMACFTEVVEGLPNGFASSIKEKGVNLSGGQQQRLALARGLLACSDKEIVLLDEPTSSLDALTEMTVYKNIFREFKEKTVISSIHRLHLLPLFDRICVFEGGRIIAEGTLPKLLASCPKFASLWEAMQKTLVQKHSLLEE